MRADLRGLIERIDLGGPSGLIPLFEAISNANDAIEDRHLPVSARRINVRLIEVNDLATQGGDQTLLIDGFEISDNGVGFDDAHIRAFGEAYTLSKVKIGGKGVGRFMYLKVFSTIRIRSVFESGGKRYARIFGFHIDEELPDSEIIEETCDAVGTVITMQGMDRKYQAAWPRDPEIIARRIIEHFLLRFASRHAPKITLEASGHASIDLGKLFDQSVQPHMQEFGFVADGHEFAVQAFRHRDKRAKHDYHLCANGRDVITAKLTDLLKELPEKLVDEQQIPYTLIVLITGEYLDEHANTERTQIVFQQDDALELDTNLLSRATLNVALAGALRSELAADLETTNTEKVAQIERFVETTAPEYRVLMRQRYRPLIEQKVKPGLSDDKLDEALLHIRRQIEDEVRKEERHVAHLMETDTYESYEQRMKVLMEEMNDVGKSKLADYIAHRRIILDLVGHSLKSVQEDEKYPFERVLHKMIFPMGYSSKDIFFEQQNLWLIDERLCFHTILTSDKRLNSIKGLESTSAKEPDILGFFYDTPVGVSEPNNPSGGIVIIEFKRPGRDDYVKDPADQIIQRIRDIDDGNVRDIEGRPINPKNIRYAGYLIADITPSMKGQVDYRYQKTADDEGYFFTLPNGRGYVEIISYDRLIKDAKRRNHVLFDKLGLHKN